jgi:hypothetical protein
VAIAQPIRLAPGPQLFIDDYIIENSDGLVRTTHQPQKSPEPILKGQDWYKQALFNLAAIYDHDLKRFRMWFVANRKAATGRGYYAYAESDDGIHWRQPNLGLTEIDGSSNNNAVSDDAYCIVLVDHGKGYPEPDKRFVLVHLAFGEERSLSAKYSPDGLRFEEHPGNPLFTDKGGVMSDRLSGTWDPLRKRYLITVGYEGKPQDGYSGKPPFYHEGYRRLVAQTSSADLTHFPPLRLIIASDPEEACCEEYYGMKPIVRGGLYLGFLRLLRDDMPADPGGEVHGIGWSELATSRDGENWERHPDIFLDRNRKVGTWDHAMAWIGDIVTFGDKEFIYYGGYAEGHKVGGRTIGVATLRRDGFVSRDAGSRGGRLRTRLFVLEGDHLKINAKIDGELRVRLLDPSGLPIRGFFWKDCEPIRGDSVSHNVSCSGTLATLQGKTVRLEFSLHDTELYGFALTTTSGNANGN